jgi:multiple antibiotic resistance protein
MKTFWICFVPLFVAVDALGILPMFLTLTEGIPPPQRQRIVRQSVATAAAVALAFLAVGTGLLRLLGITVADFMVAGGILLFAISLSDLLRFEKAQRRVDPDGIGAVPIGVPLITGPAVLTTSLLLLNEHGLLATGTAVLLNVAIAGVVFSFADAIDRILGTAGAKTLSKIAGLLLAAIAVMMVRKGVSAFILNHGAN